MARPKSRFSGDPKHDEYVGTKDAAVILGVSVSTIQKMVNSGKLQAWRTNGGHRRLSLESLRRVAGELAVPETVSAAPRAMSAGVSSGPLRILVVEDNAVVSKSIGKALAQFKERVEVGFTGDAAEALMKIADEQPAVVITDLAMKPFDGFHLIKVLQGSRKTAGLCIVVVTGLSDKEIQARGGLDPAIRVYHKPLSMERLAGFVDALLYMRSSTRR